MFRIRCVATTLTMALCLILTSVVCWLGSATAQEEAAAAQQPTAGAPGFAPKAVVQDESSLTEKASFFVGYKMMKDLSRQQSGKVNMQQFFEGMKAAKAGDEQKSFVAGYQMMSQFEEQGLGLSLDAIFAGMTTASSGKELGMSDEEVQTMMTAFQQVIEKRKIEEMKQESADNIAATKAYMAKNAADNPNVKTLDNGIQYEVLTEGSGEIPTAENLVKLDYHGTFFDGTVFDSSVEPPSGNPPAPIELNVGRFVPGFSSVLQKMKVGSKWRVVIPGQLAYGAQGGAGGAIGPNQALIFEISLLEILE